VTDQTDGRLLVNSRRSPDVRDLLANGRAQLVSGFPDWDRAIRRLRTVGTSRRIGRRRRIGCGRRHVRISGCVTCAGIDRPMADDVPGIVRRRPAATAARGTQAITAKSTCSVPAGSAVAIFVSVAAKARGAPTMNFPGRRLAGGSSEQQKRSSKKDTSRAESLHRLLLQSRSNERLPQTRSESSIQRSISGRAPC